MVTLDLHGMSAANASSVLPSYLRQYPHIGAIPPSLLHTLSITSSPPQPVANLRYKFHALGSRRVVVSGKGSHSSSTGGPVLRGVVQRFLEASSAVKSFRYDSRTGAFHVLLHALQEFDDGATAASFTAMPTESRSISPPPPPPPPSGKAPSFSPQSFPPLSSETLSLPEQIALAGALKASELEAARHSAASKFERRALAEALQASELDAALAEVLAASRLDAALSESARESRESVRRVEEQLMLDIACAMSKEEEAVLNASKFRGKVRKGDGIW